VEITLSPESKKEINQKAYDVQLLTTNSFVQYELEDTSDGNAVISIKVMLHVQDWKWGLHN